MLETSTLYLFRYIQGLRESSRRDCRRESFRLEICPCSQYDGHRSSVSLPSSASCARICTDHCSPAQLPNSCAFFRAPTLIVFPLFPTEHTPCPPPSHSNFTHSFIIQLSTPLVMRGNHRPRHGPPSRSSSSPLFLKHSFFISFLVLSLLPLITAHFPLHQYPRSLHNRSSLTSNQSLDATLEGTSGSDQAEGSGRSKEEKLLAANLNIGKGLQAEMGIGEGEIELGVNLAARNRTTSASVEPSTSSNSSRSSTKMNERTVSSDSRSPSTSRPSTTQKSESSSHLTSSTTPSRSRPSAQSTTITSASTFSRSTTTSSRPSETSTRSNSSDPTSLRSSTSTRSRKGSTSTSTTRSRHRTTIARSTTSSKTTRHRTTSHAKSTTQSSSERTKPKSTSRTESTPRVTPTQKSSKTLAPSKHPEPSKVSKTSSAKPSPTSFGFAPRKGCVPPPPTFEGHAKGFSNLCNVRYCDVKPRRNMVWSGLDGDVTREEIESALGMLQSLSPVWENGQGNIVSTCLLYLGEIKRLTRVTARRW